MTFNKIITYLIYINKLKGRVKNNSKSNKSIIIMNTFKIIFYLNKNN